MLNNRAANRARRTWHDRKMERNRGEGHVGNEAAEQEEAKQDLIPNISIICIVNLCFRTPPHCPKPVTKSHFTLPASSFIFTASFLLTNIQSHRHELNL